MSSDDKSGLLSQSNKGNLERGIRNLLGSLDREPVMREIEIVSGNTKQKVEEVVEQAKQPKHQISSEQADELGFVEIPVSTISYSPFQTREHFAEEELEELAQSITARGVIQPLVVRSMSEGHYELVAGERRLRAARLAGLEKIPVRVCNLSDQECLEVAIIENAQREDLNAIEEAQALKRLCDEFKMSQTEVAKLIGKNRSTVTNSMRLLQLEHEFIDMIAAGDITAGHGRALLMIEDYEQRLRFAQRILREHLSVRALEHLINQSEIAEANAQTTEEDDEEAKALIGKLQNKIENLLGMSVKLGMDNQGRKRLTMTFPSEAAWKRFMSRIRD